MDQNQLPDQPFVKKQIETPILDSQLRQQISANASAPMLAESGGGFKAFYRSNKIYFWAIFVGILIIGVLTYFALRKSPVVAPKEANVSITVDVPQQVPSGGQAVYKITLQNNDSQKLVSLQMELTYPDGMTYLDSGPSSFKPDNLSGTLFPVPDLISGQNVAVFIKTKATGNVNDQKTLNIKLHYKYANFNSEFIKQQTAVITLVASDVLIELDGPTTTNNAQLVVYDLKYQNNSDNDIQNARIKLNYPDGFHFSQGTPNPDLGSDTWNIGTLAKGGSGEIQIQGNFSSVTPGESKTATADFLILGQNGQYFVQNSSIPFTTTISSLPLLVSQQLQPENTLGVINPGDNLTLSVHFQNNGTTVANGINITVTLDSKVVDLTSLRAQGGQINNNSIIWNASGVPQLQSLNPGDSGEVTFSLKINNPAVKDASKNLTLVSSMKIQSNEYQSAFPGNQLSLKVSSPVSLNTSLTYVSGQLPPQVGKSTVYKVKLSLTNSSNDFSSGLLTAFIPLASGGFVTSSVTPKEAANVQFDPATNKLTWSVGSLPANTGRFTQARVLEFQIMLNPSSSQAHTAPTLVKDISFGAKDNFTGQEVTASARDITTGDLESQGGFGGGQVQP